MKESVWGEPVSCKSISSKKYDIVCSDFKCVLNTIITGINKKIDELHEILKFQMNYNIEDL